MWFGILLLLVATGLTAETPFVIRIVDSQTGRGVPLVELRAMNKRTWYSDSNGIVAVTDNWTMGQKLLFEVHSHGYHFERKAFDEPGVILTVKPGGRVEHRIARDNIAERLYRITGAGIYADSVMAGLPGRSGKRY